MSLPAILHALISDTRIQISLGLVAADFAFGVIAAVVKPATAGRFNFSKIADFARDDVLGKLVPWGGVYVLWKLSGPGTLNDAMNAAQNAIFAANAAAWAGSLQTSLAQLGYRIQLPFPIPTLGSAHNQPPDANTTVAAPAPPAVPPPAA